MLLALLLIASLTDWIPAHWNSNEPKTLDLLKETPINCLLLEEPLWSAAFSEGAAARGIAVLGVVRPEAMAVESARRALGAKMAGVVLEGDFDPAITKQVREVLAPSKAVLVELPPRGALDLSRADPVVGTFQGIWPGVRAEEKGAVHAAPTGGPWIDTNSGFLRFVRAATDAAVWLEYKPPPKTVIPVTRYLQAVCDAAFMGARWIVTLDEDLGRRLLEGEPSALAAWRRIALHLRYFEEHKEWRAARPYGQLALVQDADSGAMLSGSILDMIVVKHTPVLPVPRWKLDDDRLKGAKMTVDVDPSELSDKEKQVLRNFARSGGMLLSGPPGWKFPSTRRDQVTLGKQELERMDEIWKEVRSLIGRDNLGVRLFNVSSMLSNLLLAPDGRTVILQLVNYSGYPIESVTAHFLGAFHHARLLSPEAPPEELEAYPAGEGSGVDIPEVRTCATLVLD